jgi:hypothetical protein
VTAIADGNPYTVALVGAGPLRPSLTARSSEDQLILSWSTNAIGFKLQSTPSLTPPVTWIDFPNPPTILGAQFEDAIPFSGNNQFYRLRKP